jgi:hypothetical protein
MVLYKQLPGTTDLAIMKVAVMNMLHGKSHKLGELLLNDAVALGISA